MIWFLAGFFLGALALGFFYLSARRENVRLDEEKQLLQVEQQIVVDFMHELVEATGEGLSRQELFERIIHAAILGTGALSGCIFELRKNERLRGVAVEGLFPPLKPMSSEVMSKLGSRVQFIEQVLKSESYELGEGVIGSVARSLEAILIEDAGRDPRVVEHDDATLRIRSLIVAPLHMRRELIGVIALANPADGGGFTESDFSLIQSMSEQAGMAIHNADLMSMQIEKNKLDLDLTIASSIQRMLLPRQFISDSELDTDAFYRPAQKIGGDLFDLIRLSEHRVGLAIADVSGKGIPASLLMAICQTNLRHYSRKEESPAAVLRLMNHDLMDELRQDMFITLIYAIIDTQAETLTLARAGHELPIIHHGGNGDSQIETVGSEGMALGMVPADIFDVVIADKVIPFKSGDTFVLYTDGVTEATNIQGEEFSTARLLDAVSELHKRSAHEMTRGIIDAVESFNGQRRAEDDITLICAKRL